MNFPKYEEEKSKKICARKYEKDMNFIKHTFESYVQIYTYL